MFDRRWYDSNEYTSRALEILKDMDDSQRCSLSQDLTTVVNGKGVYIPNGYVEIISRNPVAMIEGFVAMNKKALVPVLEVRVNGKKKYAEVHTFNDGSEFSEYEGLHILTNNLKNWGRGTLRFYAQEAK